MIPNPALNGRDGIDGNLIPVRADHGLKTVGEGSVAIVNVCLENGVAFKKIGPGILLEDDLLVAGGDTFGSNQTHASTVTFAGLSAAESGICT